MSVEGDEMSIKSDMVECNTDTIILSCFESGDLTVNKKGHIAQKQTAIAVCFCFMCRMCRFSIYICRIYDIIIGEGEGFVFFA